MMTHLKDIQHQINGLNNVAVTELKGGYKHQFNIEVDINKLSGYNLSMGQIMQAVQSLAYNVPEIKNRTKDNKIVMLGVKNAIESAKDVGDIIVAQYMGSPIYLRQVAKIEDSYNIQSFKSALISKRDSNGKFTPFKDQVTLTVSKLQGTNAVIIAEEVKKELQTYKENLSKNGIDVKYLNKLAGKPTILAVNYTNPWAIDEIYQGDSKNIKAVIATFGTTPEAILDVVIGKFKPSGKMPFSTPISDSAAQNQKSDVPGYQEEDNYVLFNFDEGMNGY